MTDALMKEWMAKRPPPKKIADITGAAVSDIIGDVKLTVDGHELNVMKFIKHWQDQVEEIILREAKELTSNALDDKFNDVDELLFDLQGRHKEEVNKRLEEWEIDV